MKEQQHPWGKSSSAGARKLLRQNRLWLETLEPRTLLSASAAPSDLGNDRQMQSFGTAVADSPPPAALTALSPSSVRTAYGFNQTSLTGSGETIAIVDAFDDPTVQQDLAVFDQQYGLPAANLTKVEMTSGGQAPAPNAQWSTEIALDVEWAHAAAPGATILLVEAYDDSLPNLLSAVDYARNAANVSVVSMSWGASEFGGETSDDSYFTTPAGHSPVAFVASSGDAGAQAGPTWPSVVANVLSVGGTTLNVSSAGTYGSETGWSSGEGGVSSQEAEPPYQDGVQSTGWRTIPDVAYDANPATGLSVYDSSSPNGQGGWQTMGGTSAGAPQWAGLIAMADQGRAAAGETGIGSAPAAVYSLSSTDFHDITTGSNGNSAGSGYDLVTGLGSPAANNVVSGLVAADIANVLAISAFSASSSTSSGNYTSPTGSLPPPGAPAPPNHGSPVVVGPSVSIGPMIVAAVPGSPVSASQDGTNPFQAQDQILALADAISPKAADSTLTAAQSASLTNLQPTTGDLASKDSSRVDSSARPAAIAGSAPQLSSRGAARQVDPAQPPGNAGLESLSETLSFQPDAHSSRFGRVKSTSRSVTVSGPTTTYRDLALTNAPEAIDAIDDCFASGSWVDMIITAHPDALLPPAFFDSAVTSELAATSDMPAGDDGQQSAEPAWLAAAIALGAVGTWAATQFPNAAAPHPAMPPSGSRASRYRIGG